MTAGVQHRIYDDIHWAAEHAGRYVKSAGAAGSLTGGTYVHGASGHLYVANSDAAKGSAVDLSQDPDAETGDWVRLYVDECLFDDVTEFFADTNTHPAGEICRTRSEHFSYRAVASGGHVTNAGGQEFEVLPGEDGAISLLQMGCIANELSSAAANAVAIQVAHGIAGSHVFVPPAVTGWYYDTTITNLDLKPIFGPGSLIFTGTGEGYVFGAFGAGSVTSHSNAKKSELYIQRNTIDWTDDSPAVALYQCVNMKLHVESALFRYGLSLESQDGACAYNKITCGRQRNTPVGVRLWQRAGGTSPYLNANVIRGCRTSVNSGTNTPFEIAGVELRSDTDVNTINGNRFYDFDVEGSNLGSGRRSGILGSGSATGLVARDNFFIGWRYETDNRTLIAGRGLQRNRIQLVYPVGTASINNPGGQLAVGDTPEDTLLLSRNIIEGAESGQDWSNRMVPAAPSIRRGNLSVDAGSGQIFAPAFGVWSQPSGASFTRRTAAVGDGEFTLTTIVNILGVRFNLENEARDWRRRIFVRTNSPTNSHGRIAAQCFDAAGTLLTGAGDCSVGFNVALGGYRTGTDGTSGSHGVDLAFGPSVAQAIVGVMSGDNDGVLSSVEFFKMVDSAIEWIADPGGAGIDTQDSVNRAAPAVSAGDVSGAVARNISGGAPFGWYFDGTAWVAI